MGSVILVVDDETDTADLLGMILGIRLSAADVRVAYGGELALEVARHAPLRAAVLDLEMPGMGGEALALALRQAFRDAPPLLIALSGNIQRLSALTDSGAFDHHMSKPVDIEGLVRLLGGALA